MGGSFLFKKLIGFVLLLSFVFSADAAFYGRHADSLHEHAPVAASHAHDCSNGQHPEHPQEGGHQEHDDSCCNQHSHASAVFYSLTLTYTPHSSQMRVFEPFRAVPEVYLDRFIPPQNLS
ncbi:hypothetical protein [Geobacter sp. DSM 9736]|uniref:hypothetical protein n=1 Tax=Geobacter sp. DSM 9736 TaxID=1277350 RepID=UPI000B5144C1|nr:hypothetical protein [Geobacter sp. DSM 9736]SNB44769.1 hypothetical protein SAMN06269301_0156 [Geobacter sp. DSM 9736]